MMTGSFRRAHLRGSDELFRPTQPGVEADPSPVAKPAGNAKTAPHAAEALGVQRREGRLVRLSDEEVELLTDALQHLKYPTTTKPPTKPPMEVFERLEELRRKLVDGTG
jgi:hypothetical protein